MADLLSDIKKYLVQKGVKASEIFIDSIPNSPDKAVAIYEYQGSSPLAQIAGVSRSVQIVTRSKSAGEARETAISIYRSLKTESSIINFTAERWAAIHLRQPPFKFKVDESGKTYYSFNMNVTTYED